MEKSKYVDIALVLALLSWLSPILAILASLGLIPKVAIYGGLIVSGMALLGIILGVIGYKDAVHKWKSILAIVICIVSIVIDLIFSFGVIYELMLEMMYEVMP